MATPTLQLKIVTPERVIFDEEVEQVSIPTEEGFITVLPNHVALISALSKGDIVGVKNQEAIPFAVVGGFVKIEKGENKKTEVAILADFAEHVDEITAEKITEAKKRAEMLKKEIGENVVNSEKLKEFEEELERSLTRSRIASKWKTRKYRKIPISQQ